MEIDEGVPLAPHTTLCVGGPARHFAEATTEAEVADALGWARARALPVLVLGGGSNLLVADRGFDGLVLRARLRGLTVESHGGEVVVTAGAGEAWDDVVARAVAEGWAGLECLSGIPGDAGATPVQNVGAYGQEIADTLAFVRAVDRATGAAVILDRAHCGFGYRDSVFKREDAGRFVITAVGYTLRRGGAPELRYAELARRFADTAAPSLADVREAVLALRRSKSMVLDPADENGRSAGSFFTNPVVAAAEAERLAAAHVDLPRFPAPGGQVKLSAAWLIERAGFPRGTHDGPVGISTKHSLALVNRGGATAAALVAFAAKVREGVRARFGVTLAPEPVLVGFRPEELAALLG
jgi:UDP-N-acetylmuramate dehydrogenase